MNRFKNLAYAGLAAIVPPVPPPGVGGTAITLVTVKDILTTVGQYLIIFAMIIAVIMIVYGGIRWMMASDPAEAKKIVWNGIIGAAIVLAVGIILQTIGYVVTFRG